MTIAVPDTVSATRRPAAVWVTIVLLGFLGITAVGGGAALLLAPEGSGLKPPLEWLDTVPLVDSWLIPGLVLGLGFGVGGLIVAYGVLQRPRWEWLGGVEDLTGHHWSWLATILIGMAHAIWIGLELVYLAEPSVLQGVYGPVALALFLLPFLPSVGRHLRPATAAVQPAGRHTAQAR